MDPSWATPESLDIRCELLITCNLVGSSSIDTFGWALNGVQSKNKYSSPFHSINLLVGEKAGSCMYSNEGSKTYQMQSGRDEQVAGRKRTWSAMSQSMQQH
jgi:hypothetical protein